MNVFVASDHAGFVKKQELIERLAKDFDVQDVGPETLDPDDDYPIFAEKVGLAVTNNPGSFGVLLCRSGEGMEIAANKIDGVRAALVWQEHLAAETRRDNDSNVVVFASDEHSLEDLYKMTKVFLQTSFSGLARHKRRIEEIKDIETKND